MGRKYLHGYMQIFTEPLLCNLKIWEKRDVELNKFKEEGGGGEGGRGKRWEKGEEEEKVKEKKKEDSKREIEQVAVRPEVAESSHTQHILLQMWQGH